MTEIAVAAGFCDQSHLSNAFKRHMKLTPAEFRSGVRRLFAFNPSPL
ncbi:MAG: helix-turn-helix domain-containing protein [Acidobacteria bacterium]|nr:helix-turn-helix domain-containing protein [Acidobacteriota bacterium]